jgi:pimeloyl-ACP methyl ester carboxylesterase
MAVPAKEDLMQSTTAVRSTGGVSTLPEGEVHRVATSDDTEIGLTRYAMGKKGPVVLAPGYGNAARAFALNTVPKSFTQYLGEQGYDVWLLDYRASPDLASSLSQFTVDDIAMRDWPAAIGHIRAQTGADSVQALGHCVGGLSLFMAIGGGLDGLRSAIFSALAGHPIPTPANRLRAAIRLATIFRRVGIDGLNTDYTGSLPDRAVDAVMRILPFKHVHDSPVGRRIYFIYGDVFDHSRIDEATMTESVPSVFGNGNMAFFEHISLMVRKGRALDAEGRDAYLANTDRYRIPIALITGEHNRMFLPRGLEATHDTLRAANGPELYTRRVITHYAHLDCWLGRDAERDVFPIALAELERHSS